MKKLGLLTLLIVSVSAYGQGFSDGFESGSVTPNWRKGATWASLMVVQDNASYILDNTTYYVLPHSGNKLAYQQRNYASFWPYMAHDLSAVGVGTLTFWVNPINFDDNFLFSVAAVGNHGEKLRLMNSNKNIRIQRPGTTDYYPGITITPYVWHEVKFVIKDNTTTGSQVWWDGSLIADNITGIFDLYTLEMGTSWGSAACVYDDITFIPEGLTVANVTGKISLEGYSGSKEDVSVRLEARGDTTQVIYPALDSEGNFTVQGLPIGSYTFAFKAYSHLQTNVVQNIVGDTSLGTIILKSGDANGDNVVDSLDLNILAQNWGAMGGV